MAFVKKYWNGKISGIPEMILLVMSGLCRKFARRWSTFCKSSNLGSCGKHCKFGLRVIMQFPGRISFGNDVKIADDVVFSSHTASGYCHIGNNVYINSQSKFDFSGGIEIKHTCTISENVVIYTHSHGYDPRSKPLTSPLLIESNVWIGMKATILPQVNRIGKNAIIAAGAVVTHDIPDNTIVGGNPAHAIRKNKK